MQTGLVHRPFNPSIQEEEQVGTLASVNSIQYCITHFIQQEIYLHP